MMNSKLKTILYGGPLKYPIYAPDVIIGQQGRFTNGTLLDANRVTELINEQIEKHDVDDAMILKAIQKLSDQQKQTEQKLKDLVGSSPEALDTIYEIAQALNNDANFVFTINNKIEQVSAKANKNSENISEISVSLGERLLNTDNKLNNVELTLNESKEHYSFQKPSNNTGIKIKSLDEEGGTYSDFIRRYINKNGNLEVKINGQGAELILSYKKIKNIVNPDPEEQVKKLFDGALKVTRDDKVLLGVASEIGEGINIDIDNNIRMRNQNYAKLELVSNNFVVNTNENEGANLHLNPSGINLGFNGNSILQSNNDGSFFQLNRTVRSTDTDLSEKSIIRYNIGYEEYGEQIDKLNYISYSGFLGADLIECTEGKNKITIPQNQFTDTDAVNKKYVDSKFNDISYDYYGIKWTIDSNEKINGAPVRTGNMIWHKTLPIQSQMRRCTLLDDGTVNGYISDSDYTKYTDGRTAKYNGEDGQVMVEIPEYYFEAINTPITNGQECELRLYPFVKKGTKSKKFYVSAAEASSDLASTTTSTAKLYSICKTNFTIDLNNTVHANLLSYDEDAANYKGGNRSDLYANDSIKSLLGRPITNLNIESFRNIAKNRGEGWSQLYYSSYNSVLRLYFVEYCNFNSQATFNNNLTSEGFHQGGLGNGFVNINHNSWVTFNANNPLVPTLITKSLGNKTGKISFKYEENEFLSTAITSDVISYRGIENIFGHIWKFCDGLCYFGNATANKGYMYVCDDITKFRSMTSADVYPENYLFVSESTFSETIKNSGITSITWSDRGEFIPKKFGGTVSSGFYDHLWLNGAGWKLLLLGGDGASVSLAGLLSSALCDGFGVAVARFGARLLFTPKQ